MARTKFGYTEESAYLLTFGMWMDNYYFFRKMNGEDVEKKTVTTKDGRKLEVKPLSSL